MTEADVREMCKNARLKVVAVSWMGSVAVVRIEALTVDPKRAAENLYKAGAGGVVWSWNEGYQQILITEKKTA